MSNEFRDEYDKVVAEGNLKQAKLLCDDLLLSRISAEEATGIAEWWAHHVSTSLSDDFARPWDESMALRVFVQRAAPELLGLWKRLSEEGNDAA